MIKIFPYGTSCGRDMLHVQHLLDCLSRYVVANSDKLVSSITQVVNLFLDGKYLKMLVEYTASAPLTSQVKPSGGIRPIVFGVSVSGGGEAILYAVNLLIETGEMMWAFDVVVRFQSCLQFSGSRLLHPLICKIKDLFSLSLQTWYLDDGTIIGETLV
ncbi:hypothetical protein Tco_0160377, partial [Tanacetum coccineum]